MKNVLVIVLISLGVLSSAYGQEISKNAIGLRLGTNDGYGTEITYQRAIGSGNRIEMDLGWRNGHDINAYKLVGTYQWVWNLDGGFNWYTGAGAGIGNWNNKNESTHGNFLLMAGQIGVEYNFDIPLLLSLDFRPEFYLGNDYGRNSFGPDIAIGIRYQF